MKPDISLLVWHFYPMLLRISSLENNNNNNNRWAFILGTVLFYQRYYGRIVILIAMAYSDLQKVLLPHAFQRHRYACIFSR